MEKDPSDVETLNTIFRSAHTLKGMAATMGFKSFTELTHKMEDVLDIFRAQKTPITPDVIDRLLKCLDMLQMLLEEVRTRKDMDLDVGSVVTQLEEISPENIKAQAKAEQLETEPEEIKKTPIFLTQLEKDNLQVVIKDGESAIYEISLLLSEDCQMKSVRVFMVFNRLDTLGEVTVIFTAGIAVLLLIGGRRKKTKIETTGDANET